MVLAHTSLVLKMSLQRKPGYTVLGLHVHLGSRQATTYEDYGSHVLPMLTQYCCKICSQSRLLPLNVQ